MYDMYGGTASMALACIKLQRRYLGTEKDEETHTWATQRIGRAWMANERNEFDNYQKVGGVPRALTEQVYVSLYVCVLCRTESSH